MVRDGELVSIQKVLFLECFPILADRKSDRCRGLIDQQVGILGDDSYILGLGRCLVVIENANILTMPLFGTVDVVRAPFLSRKI